MTKAVQHVSSKLAVCSVRKEEKPEKHLQSEYGDTY